MMYVCMYIYIHIYIHIYIYTLDCKYSYVLDSVISISVFLYCSEKNVNADIHFRNIIPFFWLINSSPIVHTSPSFLIN